MNRAVEAARAVLITIFLLAAMIGMTYVGPAESQENWIKCRHNATGEVQMFRGMSCPWDWHPV